MKKLFLSITILVITGLVSTACVEYFYSNEFKFTLTVTLDKTEAIIGDTIIATAVFKDISTLSLAQKKPYEVELPDWIVAEGGKNKEDILRVVFTANEDFNWDDYLQPYKNIETKIKRKVKIKGGEAIKKEFKYTITEAKDLEVHAAAFYIEGDFHFYYGLIGFSDPVKITVKEQ